MRQGLLKKKLWNFNFVMLQYKNPITLEDGKSGGRSKTFYGCKALRNMKYIGRALIQTLQEHTTLHYKNVYSLYYSCLEKVDDKKHALRNVYYSGKRKWGLLRAESLEST